MGATRAVIGAAAGMTRQSAHERWHAATLAVLDRYGWGELGGPVAEDMPAGRLMAERSRTASALVERMSALSISRKCRRARLRARYGCGRPRATSA
ncbi:MAG TPA: hypothetical protein VIJ23_01075 [Mycobacterium sp.]